MFMHVVPPSLLQALINTGCAWTEYFTSGHTEKPKQVQIPWTK